MTNENISPTLEFQNLLKELCIHLEYINNHKAERDEVLNTYKTKILPNFLKIRQLNRLSKDKLEARYDELRQVNQKLLSLSDRWENLTFEASCLKHEVKSSKERLTPQTLPIADSTQGDVQMVDDTTTTLADTFEPDQVGTLSHEERTKFLELEVTKRKQLRDKLDEVIAETNEIDQVCQASEQQINRVKPYIKQLLDKVDTGESNSLNKQE